MSDNVNHPKHYQGFSNGAEVIDITENLSFNLGNVVKYVARAGRKTEDPFEDLLKAQFYLERERERLLAKEDPWTLDELTEQLRVLWNTREWESFESVPDGTVVEDKDGDYYRLNLKSNEYEILYKNDYEKKWRKMPRFLFREQEIYGPFKEVVT